MRLALAVGLALAALPVAVACGGGASTSNPLDTREPPGPSGQDLPPSSTDTPPPSTDVPPPSGDPAPGGSSCLRCRGNYTCEYDGMSLGVTLELIDQVCHVNDGMGGTTIAACGTAAYDGGSGQTNYTVSSNGSVTACSSDVAVCVTCTPGGAVAADAGAVVVNVPGHAGASNNCSALSSCCSSVASDLASSCQATVSSGNDTLCSAALTEFKSMGGC